MSHSILCAEASRARCRCSCKGLLHGHVLASTGAGRRCSQPTLVGSDGRGRVGGQALPAAQGNPGSDLGRWVNAHRSLATELTHIVVDHLWLNADELPELDQRRLAHSDHAACALLAATAAGAVLRALPSSGPSVAFAEALQDGVAQDMRARGIGVQRGLVVTVLCIAAVVGCPDVAWHPEVQSLDGDPAHPMHLARLTKLGWEPKLAG